MTGWNEIKAALDRAEKEIARLYHENAELRLEIAETLRAWANDERVAQRLRPRPAGAHHDPGNYLGRIEHIWAFLSSDAGGEGVLAGPLGPPYGLVPFIAADEARLASLGPLARQIGKASGKVVILAKFTVREDVERIEP